LTNADRTLLAEIYGQANSVFEYGLGESTYIANHVGVARYAGTDSDAALVAVSTHFRFYFADIGETKAWGNPEKDLPKKVLHYQLIPLISEPEPFDVYSMVDGRWRMACLMISFLHASTRGADLSHTKVLLHDCEPKHKEETRLPYLRVDHLLDGVRHSGDKLCVYQRKPNTTDGQLYDIWLENFDVVQ
jgi:protein O-GlcNAc transferase